MSATLVLLGAGPVTAASTPESPGLPDGIAAADPAGDELRVADGVSAADPADVEQSAADGALAVDDVDAQPTPAAQPATDLRVDEPVAPSMPTARAATLDDGPARVVASPADTVKVAWVDDSVDSTQPATLPYTLQQALDAATDANRYVHLAGGSLTFTKGLTVKSSVTLVSASQTTVAALWTIGADGVTFTDTAGVDLTSTAAAGKSVVTVASGRSGVTLRNLDLTAAAANTTGVNLAGTTGVTLDNLRFDAPAGDGGYGITARSGASAIEVDGARISGVSVGFYMHGNDTAEVGARFTDVVVSARTSGFQLGKSVAPTFTRVSVRNPGPVVANAAAIDLAGSTGAVVQDADLAGFAYGIRSTATAGAGAQISDSRVDAATMGIALGTTESPAVVRTEVSGGTPGVAGSIGIDAMATGVRFDSVTVAGFPVGLRNRITSGPGTTAANVQVTGATHGAMTIGTSNGSSLTDLRLDLTGYTAASTTTAALALANSEDVVVRGLTVVGYPSGVTTTGTAGAGAFKAPITIKRATFTDVTTGISLNNITGAAVRDVTITTGAPGGSGVYLRWVDGTTVERLDVTGTPGTTHQNGTNGIRSYYSANHTIRDVRIAGGSTGFYFDTTEGIETAGATVSGMTWYGIYAERVQDWTMRASHFHDNNAVGNLAMDPTGRSANVRWTGSTFTGHTNGVFMPLGFTGFQFDNNTVVAENARYVFILAPAHEVDVHDNNITFTPLDDTSAAMIIGNDNYANRDDPTDYTSSDVRVVGNTFAGSGPFVRTGSTGGRTTALRDAVVVRGNTFPQDSVAIVATPHARGDGDGVAVDARDFDQANDWGSVCRPTVELTAAGEDGTVTSVTQYAGGGATIAQSQTGQVLYPTQCIDLSLAASDVGTRNHEPSPAVARSVASRDGEQSEVFTWTLTPRNDGPAVAPAGWSVTQLLPDGAELVSMTGEGYAFDGLTATATETLGRSAEGPAITVTVRVSESVWADDLQTQAHLRGVAYVAPLAPESATDVDGDGWADHLVEHHNPLVVPTLDTRTGDTETNNDAEVGFELTRDLPGGPAGIVPGGAEPGGADPGVGIVPGGAEPDGADADNPGAGTADEGPDGVTTADTPAGAPRTDAPGHLVATGGRVLALTGTDPGRLLRAGGLFLTGGGLVLLLVRRRLSTDV